VSPSGKLPTTFTTVYEDVPSSENFPGKELADEPVMGPGGFPIGVPSEVIYEEGIYVGYRYFSTFDVEPEYEFGYGLSYTDFDYSEFSLSSSDFEEQITVSVEVTNSGDVAGREVAQLYISAPEGDLDKPEMELKGFAKTALLEPGESEEIEFTITPRSLSSFNADKSAWIANAGTYEVRIGTSSEQIKVTDTFDVPQQLIVEKTNRALIPNREIDELY
jgi:beta-glucosidase